MGDDPSTWSWGAIHPLRLTHPFSAQSSLLSGWNMPEVPWAGDGNTLNAANYTWTSDDMPVTGMASLRIVMPLGDLNSVVPPPCTRHCSAPDKALRAITLSLQLTLLPFDSDSNF